MLNFDTESMRRIFDAAVERAQAGTLWLTPAMAPDHRAVGP